MGSQLQYWSTVPSSNASSDPDISSSDNQAPNTLDDNVRSIMAACRKLSNDIGGKLVAGGSANALTVTTWQILISGQLGDGLRLMLQAASANTSTTVTFAADGLTAYPIKRADGTALAVGSIQAGMMLDLCFRTSTSEWWAANILPAAVIAGGAVGATNVGTVLLTSGTWSSQATGDIVLSSYTGYRGFQIVLSGVQPVSANVDIWMRLSANAGVSYDSGANNYGFAFSANFSAPANDTKIGLTGAAAASNATTGGYDGVITVLNANASGIFPKVLFEGAMITGSQVTIATGGGFRANAQITNAVRFLFSSGNIAAGNYAVYGLN